MVSITVKEIFLFTFLTLLLYIVCWDPLKCMKGEQIKTPYHIVAECGYFSESFQSLGEQRIPLFLSQKNGENCVLFSLFSEYTEANYTYDDCYCNYYKYKLFCGDKEHFCRFCRFYGLF